MRKLLFIIAFTIVALLPAGAQSVGHGADIDAQINGKATTRQNKKPAAEPHKTPTPPPAPSTPDISTSNRRMKMVLRKIKVRKKTPEELAETKTKVTMGIHHEQGFRIQVYSGGNTRIARQEAERAGQKVKSVLPTQPVYVHFYSPRWSCRVGNFRTYNAALGALSQIRKVGYKGAIIIRSVITVKDVEYVDDDTMIDDGE